MNTNFRGAGKKTTEKLRRGYSRLNPVDKCFQGGSKQNIKFLRGHSQKPFPGGYKIDNLVNIFLECLVEHSIKRSPIGFFIIRLLYMVLWLRQYGVPWLAASEQTYTHDHNTSPLQIQKGNKQKWVKKRLQEKHLMTSNVTTKKGILTFPSRVEN